MVKSGGAADPTAEDVRGRIRRDLERLNPRARMRYRMALRRLMRHAEDEERGRARIRLSSRLHLTVTETLALTAAVGAFAAVAMLMGDLALAGLSAIMAGLAALAMADAPDPDGVEDARDVIDAPPQGDPARTALALHVAAMAESRHAYYVGQPPSAETARRSA